MSFLGFAIIVCLEWNGNATELYASKTIVLDRGNYTSCTINLFGANITSWRIRNTEQLFVSTQAILDGTMAIRGGIPLIFPQYGPWTFGPHHGFARIMNWKVKKQPTRLDNKDIQAVLYLEDDYYSRSMWNHAFQMEYEVTLQEVEMKLSIKLCNPDKDLTLYANILMHPYFRVPNVKECKIVGFESEFYDKVTDLAVAEGIPIIRVFEETDRVYKNTGNAHIITNVMNQRKLKIEKDNCPDTVMWNPWVEKARDLIDFGEEDYLHMICLAAGYASQPLKILPNQFAETSMTMRLMREDLFADLSEQRKRFHK